MPVNLRDVGLCAEDLSRMDSVKVEAQYEVLGMMQKTRPPRKGG